MFMVAVRTGLSLDNKKCGSTVNLLSPRSVGVPQLSSGKRRVDGKDLGAGGIRWFWVGQLLDSRSDLWVSVCLNITFNIIYIIRIYDKSYGRSIWALSWVLGHRNRLQGTVSSR